MKKHKPIFTKIGPLIKVSDVILSLRYLLLPWNSAQFKVGDKLLEVKNFLIKLFDCEDVYLLDSARSGLFVALSSLDLKSGDEVIVQAYTCQVVINAILHAGGVPIYIDIGSDYNLDPNLLERSITTNTKAIIFQHTFGVPADYNRILMIAKKYGILTIEDSAHIVGLEIDGRQIGTFGDIGIISFGSEKFISSARGGAIIVNNPIFSHKIKELYDQLDCLPYIKIWQHLITFPIFYFGKKLFSSVGRPLMYILSKLNITAKIIYPYELKAERSDWHPTKYPNALSHILLSQLHSLDTNIAHRKKISEVYLTMLDNSSIKTQISKPYPVMQFALEIDEPLKLYQYLETKNIYASVSWSQSVIVPSTVDLKYSGYKIGTARQAERVAISHISLPTHENVTTEDARYVADTILQYLNIKK